MAPEKVTDMVLNVDLKCSHCYKKVKKVICKIPQIRDQVFDVDKNTVKIKVVCCSPEKIRDKLCYKGEGAIQSIEIIEKSEKPKAAEKPKLAGKAKDLGKPPEPDKPKPKDVQEPKDAPEKPDPGPNSKVARMVYEPVHDYPQMYPLSGYPMVGYGQYYDHGYGGAPFQHDYGMSIAPPPQPPSYGGFGYDNGYERYNGKRSLYTSNDYGGQEKGESCSIM